MKLFLLIALRVVGSTAVFKLLQYSKAYSPIEVMPSDTITDLISGLSLKGDAFEPLS